MAVELKRRDRKVHFALIAIMVGSGPRIDKAITITSTYIHTYIYYKLGLIIELNGG
jgi:hypothetical protein